MFNSKFGTYVDTGSNQKKEFPSIELDEFYLAMGKHVGTVRQLEHEKNFSLAFSNERHLAEVGPHIVGAYGEATCCLIAGVPWLPTINTYRTRADAGLVEIRAQGGESVSFKDKNGLDAGLGVSIKPGDSDDSVIVSMGFNYDRPNYFVCFGYNYVGTLRHLYFRDQKGGKKLNPDEIRKTDILVSRTCLLPIESLNKNLFFFKDSTDKDRIKQIEKDLEIANKKIEAQNLAFDEFATFLKSRKK